MAGLIPQSFIDDLLARTDIVEVVDRRVRLKKSGRNYMACCPFHDEKTPSFSVSQEKQFYHCFGCGASGNAIGFLMAYENLDFPRAVESLAQSQGMDVPREALSEQEQRGQRQQQDLCALLEQAGDYYRQQLDSHPAADKARAYLGRRGLSQTVIEQFGIGYAPPGWDNLLQHLRKLGWQESQLLDSGMLVEREGNERHYDRFRDRIMFPIRDVRGRVIAFGGRVLGDEKPKYLNSPETVVFSKGKELYGLYEAGRSKPPPGRLVVVEGYMDVVALAQYGLVGAVATLGTAAGTPHLEKAFRQCQDVVFCFDGDMAGRRAAARALEAALPVLREQRQVRFLFLPEGEDPDTYVRSRGVDSFVALMDKAMPLSEYLFDHASQGLDLQTAEGRAALVTRCIPLLEQIPAGPFSRQMFVTLSLRTQLDAGSLEQMARRTDQGPAWSAPVSPRPGPALREPLSTPVKAGGRKIELSLPEAALHLLLHYPHLYARVVPWLPRLQQVEPAGPLLWLVRLVALLQEQPQASRSRLLGIWHGRYGNEASGRLYELADRESLLGSELLASRQLDDILRRLVTSIEHESPLERLIAKSRETALTEPEKQELARLLRERSTPMP